MKYVPGTNEVDEAVVEGRTPVGDDGDGAVEGVDVVVQGIS